MSLTLVRCFRYCPTAWSVPDIARKPTDISVSFRGALSIRGSEPTRSFSGRVCYDLARLDTSETIILSSRSLLRAQRLQIRVTLQHGIAGDF